MKHAVLVSVRGSYSDPLTYQLVKKGIIYLHEKFPNIPITLAFEDTPNHSYLETLVTNLQDNVLEKRKSNTYSQEDQYFDAVQIGMLKTALDKDINFDVTDIPEMDSTPPEARQTEEFKKRRQYNMADKLRKNIETKGGIIIDFGGLIHASRIQKLIENHKKKHTSFEERLLEIHFCCVYSGERQDKIPGEYRIMQFTAVNKEMFPLGLKFINTSLGLNDPAPTSVADIKRPTEAERNKEKEEVLKKAEEDFISILRNSAEMLLKIAIENTMKQQSDNGNNNTSSALSTQLSTNVQAITFSTAALSLSNNNGGNAQQSLRMNEDPTLINRQGSSEPDNTISNPLKSLNQLK